MTKQPMLREEFLKALDEARRAAPKLHRFDWETIYKCLSRERKRVQNLLAAADEALPDGHPEVNQFLAKVRDQITHISRIMKTLGQGGANMMGPYNVGKGIYIVDDPSDPTPEDERMLEQSAAEESSNG